MDQLTDREREVAGLAHLSNTEIAKALGISPNTVKVHMVKIFAQLNITSRAQLARLMAQSERAAKK